MSLSVQRRPQRQVQAAVLTKPEALAERSASPLSQALVAAALAGHGLDGMGPVIVLDLALTEAGVAPEHRLLNASQERLREAMGLAQTELGLLSLDAGAVEGDVLTGDVESSAEQSAEGAASEANLSAVMRAALSVFRHAYGDAPPDVMRRVETMLGGGSPLASDQAERFGAVLGHDLSDVRVHVGAEVSALARALNAHAFTVGTDIFFGSGELSPGTPGGDRLLLHELTHVAQAIEGRLPTEGGVSDPSDHAEREASFNERALAPQLDAVDAGWGADVAFDAPAVESPGLAQAGGESATVSLSAQTAQAAPTAQAPGAPGQAGQGQGERLICQDPSALVLDEDLQPKEPSAPVPVGVELTVLDQRQEGEEVYVRVAQATANQGEAPNPLGWVKRSDLVAANSQGVPGQAPPGMSVAGNGGAGLGVSGNGGLGVS
ncbi:DUF4157 domain-containing protein [Myxococcota bacterium]|nr:DUF4157 domain-containing protein [Myxococcota bacterium]